MVVCVDKPLCLPYLAQIREELLARLPGAQKIVFKEPGMDAGGLQLLLALKKEFPRVEVEAAFLDSDSPLYSVFKSEVEKNVPDRSS